MNLLPTPGAGFDQPFEMLSACHERVQRTLDLLRRLQSHLAAAGADAQARQAARDVMRYFDIAAPAHHEDEERHVFPALLAADPARHGPLVARLQDDHRRMAAQWPAVRAGLAAVAEGRWSGTEDAVWAGFAALHAGHIPAEEGIAFPSARLLFDADAQQAMGTEMARRRGLTGVNMER
jgi:hemerythrin-like domain-containing protein